jgi:hypothetical protein
MNRFGRRCRRGIHIGAQWSDGMTQIVLTDRVIPLEHAHGPMPGDRHDPKVIDASPPHIRHECMAEIVKHDTGDLRPLTGRLKRTPDGPDPSTAIGEHEWHTVTTQPELNCKLPEHLSQLFCQGVLGNIRERTLGHRKSRHGLSDICSETILLHADSLTAICAGIFLRAKFRADP